MKLSNLIKRLYESSEFTSVNSLANYTGQTQPTTDAFLKGNKSIREKEDALFDALTSDITEDELIAAIDLIKKVRLAQIERDQVL